MLDKLKSLFSKKQCIICKQKAKAPQTYYNDKGDRVLVCKKCVPYAERRAMRKE